MPGELADELGAEVRVVLENELQPWVSAKDVILEMLRRLTVKGGINKAYEFDGPGVATLNATERATICNMILELGATAGIFPGDGECRKYLEAEERGQEFRELLPDPGDYRPKDEVTRWKQRDPLEVTRSQLVEELGVAAADVDAGSARAEQEVRDAVAAALAAPYPDPATEVAMEYAP